MEIPKENGKTRPLSIYNEELCCVVEPHVCTTRRRYEVLQIMIPGLHEKYHRKFGYAYEIHSARSKELMGYFHSFCREHHIVSDVNKVFEYLREFPENKGYEQLF